MKCGKCGATMDTCSKCGWKKRGRTLTQNSLAHALWAELATRMGLGPEGPELIKEAIKEKYGFKTINPFNHTKLVVKPSHLYDVEDWTVLIEGTYQEASEQGIILKGE